MEYTLEEIKPEGFESVINDSGKIYHFGIFTNAAAIEYRKKYGDIPIYAFFGSKSRSNGDYNAFIAFICWWLMAPAERADFKSIDDLNEKILPYYVKQNDFDNKILKCLSLCLVKKDGEPDKAERFPKKNKTNGNPSKTIKVGNWFTRLFGVKPPADTNNTV